MPVVNGVGFRDEEKLQRTYMVTVDRLVRDTDR